MGNHKTERDWEQYGLRCVVLGLDIGHRCGYVGIPESHPLYGVGYGEESDVLENLHAEVMEGDIGKRGIIPILCAGDSFRPDVVFDVHGGLTYSGGGGEYPVASDGLWWFGFDCGHYGDANDVLLMTGNKAEMWDRILDDGIVRSTEYVAEEVAGLAKQLAAIHKEE